MTEFMADDLDDLLRSAQEAAQRAVHKAAIARIRNAPELSELGAWLAPEQADYHSYSVIQGVGYDSYDLALLTAPIADLVQEGEKIKATMEREEA